MFLPVLLFFEAEFFLEFEELTLDLFFSVSADLFYGPQSILSFAYVIMVPKR